jgi:hypothetical protein
VQERGEGQDGPIQTRSDLGSFRAVDERRAELTAVVAGVALIVVYSIVMLTTDDGSGWAWVLLIAGIGLLAGGGRLLRRKIGS